MALELVSQPQLVEEIAEDTGYSKSDVRHFLTALTEITQDHLEQCQRVRIGNLVQLEPRVRGPQKAKMGRNPRTGEPVKIPKKGASVKIGARVLVGAKKATPSLARARKALGK